MIPLSALTIARRSLMVSVLTTLSFWSAAVQAQAQRGTGRYADGRRGSALRDVQSAEDRRAAAPARAQVARGLDAHGDGYADARTLLDCGMI